jgi:hypothetical protein
VVLHVAARVRARRGSPTGKASVWLAGPCGHSVLGVDSFPTSQMRDEWQCEAEMTRNQVKPSRLVEITLNCRTARLDRSADPRHLELTAAG